MEMSFRIETKGKFGNIDKVFALGTQIGQLHFNLTEPFSILRRFDFFTSFGNATNAKPKLDKFSQDEHKIICGITNYLH